MLEYLDGDQEIDAVFGKLLAQPRARRELLVRNDRRFCEPGAIDRLLEEARMAAFEEPALGEHFARLAVLAAEGLDISEHGRLTAARYRGLALASCGNARRLACDLEGAEDLLEEAVRLLRDEARSDLDSALAATLLASLRKDQRRFAEALDLLERAIEIYAGVGDDLHHARALCTLGSLHLDAGAPEQALSPLMEALALLDQAEDPRTALNIRHNLALTHAEVGRFPDARRVFESCRPLYALYRDRWTDLRSRWLEGILASGEQSGARAEELLEAVCADYRRDGLDYDSALVGLDLAFLYARQGRYGDLRRLVQEMMPTFFSRHLHREAVTALAFLRRAVEAERVTAETVRTVATYLRRSRFHPGLRFPHG
ncbi:MAG: tetratricopeptide repeat protein [Candidatus Rokuibacteriota bacterium]